MLFIPESNHECDYQVNTNVIHERDSISGMETLGERMAWARQQLGLSQDELAKAAGVSQGTIGNAESGLRKNPRELQGIADALDVRYRWLRYGELPIKDGVSQVDERSLAKVSRAHRADEVHIPQMDVTGSMGFGASPPDHAEPVQVITAKVSELRKQCSFTAPENLQIITGYGRSMMPTFTDGDPLLVDTGVQSVEIDAIYVFSIGRDVFIKGLQRIPGNGLRVISHNRDEFDPWDLSEPQMQQMMVHGRVVLAWNSRRL